MKFTRKLSLSTLTFAIAFLGFACSDSSNNSETATISGKVEGSNEKVAVADGTIVSAAYISSNGSVQSIDGTDVETTASGNFDVAVDADSYQNIVVQAKSDTETTMGFVSTKVENGQSYTIKPINEESSAETKVFAELVASGNSDMINKSEIETVITSSNAAQVNSSTSSVNSIAAGLENSARVRAEFFSNEFGSEANAKMEAVVSAMIEAQSRLETQLNSAGSVEAREEAYASFRSDFANAYLDTEMEASAAAKVVEMWGRVFVNSTNSVSSDVKNEMNTEISLVTATIVDTAVRIEMEKAGAEESSKDAVVQAGITLKSEINASAGAMAEIRTAFENYKEEVKAALENDSNFSATAVITVDTEINSDSGAKSTFDGSIAATVSTELVLNIYNSFYSSIEASVESNFEGSTEKIEAITELMILINTAS